MVRQLLMPISPAVADAVKALLLSDFLKRHADELNGTDSSKQQQQSSSKQASKQLSAQEAAKQKKKLEAEFDRRYRVRLSVVVA